MRIAILGDTHSRYQTVENALQILRKKEINLVIHCGDIDDADTVCLFDGFTTHFVLGNSDWDKAALRQAMQETGATLHEAFGNLAIKGVTIAWTHGDDKRLLRDLENSQQYDFLFYGHTHQREQHKSGKTVVANPGALHRARPKTFNILDLDSRTLETVEVLVEARS